VSHIDNPKYTNFSYYSDERAEELMDDSVLMEFMQCAMDTNNPKHVLEAAKMIVTARDHREITIRRMADDFE